MPKPVRVISILSDDQRWDDWYHMPNTAAWLRAGGIEFMQHRADAASCAPGRESFFTGKYTHNHGVGLGNTTDDYYNYCVDGFNGIGPHESIVGGSEDTSGSLPNWLKLAFGSKITTGFVGKYQNGYGDYDNRASPVYTSASRYTRQPAGWDYWCAGIGGIATEGTTTGGAFYQKTVTSASWSGGVATIGYGSQPTPLALKPGDWMVLEGFTPSAWNGSYVVTAYTSTSANLTMTSNPGTATVLGTVSGWGLNGGGQNRYQFVLNENGTARFYDYSNGALGNSGTTPSAALPGFQSTVLGDKACRFISERQGNESWWLHVCPEQPHQAADGYEVEPPYEGSVSRDEFALWNNEPGETPPTMADQPITSWTLTILDVVLFGSPQWSIDLVLQCSHGLGSGQDMAIVGTGTIFDHYYDAGEWDRDSSTQITVTIAGSGHLPEQYEYLKADMTETIPGQRWDKTVTDTGQVIQQERIDTWEQRIEMLRSLDDMIGQIRDCLADRGWDDSTIVLYTSDNGWQLGEHATIESTQAWTGKGYIWDASVRCPLIIRYPQWRHPGMKHWLPTMHADLPLTILDFFGLDDAACTRYLGFNPHDDRDGRSLLRLFSGQDTYQSRAIYLAGLYDGTTNCDGAVDATGIKILQRSNGSVRRTYDTVNDPGEATDITSSSGAAASAQLASRMSALKTCVGETCRTA